MKIEFFGKGYNVSDHNKEITEKKCKKLEKLFGEDSVAKFTITLDNSTYKTELLVVDGSDTYRATAESADPYSNLDIIIPKITGQKRKAKSMFGKAIRDAVFGKKRTSNHKEEPILDEEPPKPEVL